jgi:hypothetical protein
VRDCKHARRRPAGADVVKFDLNLGESLWLVRADSFPCFRRRVGNAIGNLRISPWREWCCRETARFEPSDDSVV